MKVRLDVPVSWHEGSGYHFEKTVSIICDREDRETVASRAWEALRDSLGNTTLYTNIGTDPYTVYLPLGNYLLGVDNFVFVTHVNGRTDDFRKSNLNKQ